MSPTESPAAPAATDPGMPDPQDAVTPAAHDVEATTAPTPDAAPAETPAEAGTDDPGTPNVQLQADDADDVGESDGGGDGDTPGDTANAHDAAPAAAAAPRLSPAECAQQLKSRFPALFAGAPKPVKLRIQADIQAAAPGVFAKPILSAFLRRHTGSTAYLLALSRATHRVDLAGQAAGEVSDEHRAAANEELARRRALVAERRAEEDAQRALADQQRRNRAGLLRDFERTTLTRANFCALKGVAEDALDGLLDIARREAAEAPPPAPDRGRWGERGPGPRRDGAPHAAPAREGERRPGPRSDGPRSDGERRGPGGPGGRRPDGGRPPRR